MEKGSNLPHIMYSCWFVKLLGLLTCFCGYACGRKGGELRVPMITK